MMIDIHSHILPGVDDGAEDLDQALAMARAAVDEGISTIVATPHDNLHYENSGPAIRKAVQKLNQAIQQEGIPLKVLSGQEPRISGDLITRLQNQKALVINEMTRYVLVEFPHDDVPDYAGQLFYDLQLEGYTPVIVHPERNLVLQQHPDKLYTFAKNGCLMQVTAGSVAGQFGATVKKLTHKMMEANLVHLLASDAHSTGKRTFFMKEAYDAIETKYGKSTMHRLQDNAAALIHNEILDLLPPKPVKKSFLSDLFAGK